MRSHIFHLEREGEKEGRPSSLETERRVAERKQVEEAKKNEKGSDLTSGSTGSITFISTWMVQIESSRPQVEVLLHAQASTDRRILFSFPHVFFCVSSRLAIIIVGGHFQQRKTHPDPYQQCGSLVLSLLFSPHRQWPMDFLLSDRPLCVGVEGTLRLIRFDGFELFSRSVA